MVTVPWSAAVRLEMIEVVAVRVEVVSEDVQRDRVSTFGDVELIGGRDGRVVGAADVDGDGRRCP